MSSPLRRIAEWFPEAKQKLSESDTQVSLGRTASIASIISSLALFILGIIQCSSGNPKQGISFISVSIALFYLAANTHQALSNLQRLVAFESGFDSAQAWINLRTRNQEELLIAIRPRTLWFDWAINRVIEWKLNQRSV